ncbi:MAG: hypothetical protein LKG20_10340 [Tetrasphaera jenkinsii]|jgi:hypothetical protein|nr:hypothetical protein [Tetrasphaera jenkinsii]
MNVTAAARSPALTAAKKSLSTCSGDAGRVSAHHPHAASNAVKRTITPAAGALRRGEFSKRTTVLLLSIRISEKGWVG